MSTQLSGVDLARQALVAAREAAKKTAAPVRRSRGCAPARLCAGTVVSRSVSVPRAA
ncbi:hypothetical protein ACWD0Z_19010 [Streptomyces sp. NPDC003007]